MKLQFRNTPLIMAAIFAFFITGCLKDQQFEDGQTQAFAGSQTQVISLGINTRSAANNASIAVSNILVDTTMDFLPVELGGPNNAGQDIHITIDTSSALVDSLNAANDASGIGNDDYVFPSGITIVNNVVTIKKGSRVGYLQIKFVPHDQIGLDVAMGFLIKSVAEPGYTISGNLSTGTLAIIIKNKYDGKYNLREYTSGWSAYSIADGVSYNWPSTVIFASTGSNSNLITTNEAGSAQVGFSPSGGILSFGAATPQYDFDPATDNLKAIDNLTPDSRNRAFTPNAAVTTSRWDSQTGNIYISYYMSQNGRPNMLINDTLTYVGPR
jgi:hypothetical protein